MTDAMRIGIGLLYYRAWPEVRGTLDAVLAQTRPPDLVVVLDNGSADGSARQLQKAYEGLEVVELESNTGPSGGFKRVVQAVLERDVDALLYLTDDCLLAPDALEHLAARLEQEPELGAVGPLIGYASEPNRVWSAGGEIHPRNWDTGHLGHGGAVADFRDQPPRTVDWLDGSGLLMRADAVRQTGDIHEDFFYFFEETDFLVRMRQLGWRLECLPAAVAWQEPGFPPPYVFVRNRLGFLARNAPRRVVARELLRVGYYVARDAIRPRPGVRRDELAPRLKGAADFLRRRWGPMPPSQAGRRASTP